MTLSASLQWQKPAPDLTAQVGVALEAGHLITIRTLTQRPDLPEIEIEIEIAEFWSNSTAQGHGDTFANRHASCGI